MELSRYCTALSSSSPTVSSKDCSFLRQVMPRLERVVGQPFAVLSFHAKALYLKNNHTVRMATIGAVPYRPPSARALEKLDANSSTIVRRPFRTASETSSFGP
jgi:hypothetical protein